MEVLSRKMLQQQDQGLITRLKLSRKAEELSHLFFAEDALLLVKGTMGNVRNLIKILESSCNFSEEMINVQKILQNLQQEHP